MPDPLKKSISATQSPALLGASPYLTPWMLYRWFKYGDRVDGLEHNRMDWGKRMEPLCLAQAAEDLHFEVRPTRQADGEQPYVRNGQLGCTRDAQIICPDRGPGALESKCVFAYNIWMDKWNGGKNPPREIEIQLQHQMLVGDGDGSPPYKWGVISAWCGAEQFYFERKPIPDLWDMIRERTAAFFRDLEAGNEPDPVGSPIEMPALNDLLPITAGSVLDWSHITEENEHIRAMKLAEDTRLLAWHSTERLGHERAEKQLKAELRAIAGTNETVLLPYGIKYTVKQSPRAGFTVAPTTTTTVKPFVPDNLPEGLLGMGNLTI